MISTLLFIILLIITAVFLFITSLTATIGASSVFNSKLINSVSEVNLAYQLLTAVSILGWSILIVLVVTMIVLSIMGGFNLDKESLNNTTQIITIVMLVLIATITLIVNILSVASAINLVSFTKRDQNVNSGYVQSVIASLSGISAIGIMVVVIIIYFGFRSKISNVKLS